MLASGTHFGDDASDGVFTAYEALLVLSGICGVIALSGIFRWGHQNIWVQATLGVAFSIFFLGMSHAGP
jgi:hypothetical protein